MTALRISCDFNKRIDETLFSLATTGARHDLARSGVVLAPGLALELVDADIDDGGSPTLLVVDAIVVDRPPWGLVAQIDVGSWRSEPRQPDSVADATLAPLPYVARYPVGSRIRVVSRSALASFRASWTLHHPLTDVQLQWAGREATVTEVAFYHGGDPLYLVAAAQEQSGYWHEECSSGIPMEAV